MYSRRVLLAVYARLALWIIGAAFVAWTLLGTNLINDFFTFWLSGTLPGTHISVSPNVGIVMAAGCLALLFGTLMTRAYVRHIRRQIGPVWTAPPAKLTVRAVAVPETPRHVRQRYFGVPRIVRLRLVLAVWQQYSSATLGEIGLKLSALLRTVLHALLVAAARTLVGTLIVAGLMYRQFIGICRFIGEQSVSVWHFLEPYLWKFDGWLEKRVHATCSRLMRSLRRFELTLTVQEIIKNYKEPAASLQPVVDEQNSAAEPQARDSYPD